MKILSLIAVLVILCLASQMDYEDAVSQEADYCDMVEQGAWPNYRDDIDCQITKGE